MYTIDEIMDLLDSNRSLEEQEKGLELARQVKCINVFLQPCHPNYNKNVWDNCAKVLAEKTDEELQCCLTQLFEWIEDLNWPGAICIFERLQQYKDKKTFALVFNECVTRAYLTKKKIWLQNLMEVAKIEDYLYKEAVLGEWLYSISNGEKGRISTRKIWTKQYKKSLIESLEIMEKLIYFLNRYEDITVEEMTPVLLFAKRYFGYCINLIDIEKLVQNPSKVIFAKEFQWNQEYITDKTKEIGRLIGEIITECKWLLVHRGKNYKKKVSYLLRALHNLPKIYLNPEKITFCNFGMEAITSEEALEYAKFYLEMKEKY